MVCSTLILATALLLVPTVRGWGKEGHEIIANIAYGRLSSEARTAVDEILRREDAKHGHDGDNTTSPLAAVANWADRVRYTKFYHWSAPLHFVDIRDKEIPGGCPCSHEESSATTTLSQTACRFVYGRDCVDDKCAAGAISNYTNRMTKLIPSGYRFGGDSWKEGREKSMEREQFRGERGPSPGLVEISDDLAAFLGRGKRMTRSDAVKGVWSYIRDHELQNPKDRREILLDDLMRQVFGVNAFTMFTMHHYVGPHLEPFAPVDLNADNAKKERVAPPNPERMKNLRLLRGQSEPGEVSADREQADQALRVSLMFATHFVGDIHQPLHCSRLSDRGGNAFKVIFDHPVSAPFADRDLVMHSQWTLHSVWDTGIIERSIKEQFSGSQHQFEQSIIQLINEKSNSGMVNKWLKCSDGRDKACTSQWAEESLDDALMWAYKNSDGSEVVDGSELTDEYYTSRLPVVKRRLAAAGVRLAASLEVALVEKK